MWVVDGAQGDGATVSRRQGPAKPKPRSLAVGSGISIRNLTLANIHVPDGNGAGIRAEGKDLTVDHVKFIGNENGIPSPGEKSGVDDNDP